MKIICLIDSLGSGGAQRQLVELAKGFKQKGHNISFVTYQKKNFFKYDLENNNIPVYTILESNYFKTILKIRILIRTAKPDAVLSFLHGANLIATISSFPHRKWSLVVGERSANPNILKSFKLRFFRWFHLFTDYIVANSNANIKILNSVCPFLSKKKCRVIYNLIDFGKWKPINDFIPLSSGKIKIVVTASHRYLKNLDGLIEAVNMLTSKEREKLIIDWYGDNVNEPYFDGSIVDGRKKIEMYGMKKIFQFHKATSNINDIVSKADCVGLFSLYEGLPNAVCEGMASGKVVIASNVSDVPMLIKNPKLRFDPTDPKSICKTIKYILNMKKEDFIKEGNINYNTALEKFKKNEIIEEYLKLLSR